MACRFRRHDAQYQFPRGPTIILPADEHNYVTALRSPPPSGIREAAYILMYRVYGDTMTRRGSNAPRKERRVQAGNR